MAPVFGGGIKCGRCGTNVYQNEQIIAANKSWHKRGCFTCKTCSKNLESTTVQENKESGEIYCRGCYGKAYGPKGYGFGGGAGALTNTGK